MNSAGTRTLNYAGRSVTVADLPEYKKFYAKLAAGAWEPRTFATLEKYLDCNTVYVDIGAWIGIVPFWAAQIAKSVVAVEPDPFCQGILHQLAPELGNVIVLDGALASARQVTVHAVGSFGSSETSALPIGDGDSATATGLSMDQIISASPGSRYFVKIDIEGYEYFAVNEIRKLKGHPVSGIQLAVHPQLLERCLAGNRLLKRVKAAWMTWKLGRAMGALYRLTSAGKYGGLTSYLLKGVIFCRRPRGTDFVFELKDQRQ